MIEQTKTFQLSPNELKEVGEAIGREYRSHDPDFSSQSYDFLLASRKGKTCIVAFRAAGFIPFDKSGHVLKCTGRLRVENGIAEVLGCRFGSALNQ